MTLSVAVRHRLGAFELDAAFESGGRLTALFGASGSGKTSLVNIMAGLIRPDKGRIAVDGRVLVDTATSSFVPKHKRRIGYVFQDARLFPHMSVGHNLAYGSWFAPRGERTADREKIVELLGIGHLLQRKPDLLSGGEKQRVAIGRALLASPLLILMDEPLASLDEARKAEILPYIERLRDETRVPIVYVSHSVVEVGRLATDVVVLAGGKVVAGGSTAEIMQRLDIMPPDQMAEGGALLETFIDSHDQRYGMTVLKSPAGEIFVPLIDAGIGSPVRVRIRARDVIVATERPQGLSALNILAGRIDGLSFDAGPLADIRIDCNGQAIVSRLTRQSSDALGLELGQEVFAVIKTVSFDHVNTTRGIRFES
jgi:molybdate transport system ATP-binding protein